MTQEKKKVLFWFSWWRTSDIPRQHFLILLCISSRSPVTLEGHKTAPHWNRQKLLIWLVSHLNCHWVHGPGTLQMMVPLSDSWREVPVSNLRISVGAVSSSSVLRASMRYAVHPIHGRISYTILIFLFFLINLFFWAFQDNRTVTREINSIVNKAHRVNNYESNQWPKWRWIKSMQSLHKIR